MDWLIDRHLKRSFFFRDMISAFHRWFTFIPYLSLFFFPSQYGIRLMASSSTCPVLPSLYRPCFHSCVLLLPFSLSLSLYSLYLFITPFYFLLFTIPFHISPLTFILNTLSFIRFPLSHSLHTTCLFFPYVKPLAIYLPLNDSAVLPYQDPQPSYYLTFRKITEECPYELYYIVWYVYYFCYTHIYNFTICLYFSLKFVVVQIYVRKKHTRTRKNQNNPGHHFLFCVSPKEPSWEWRLPREEGPISLVTGGRVVWSGLWSPNFLRWWPPNKIQKRKKHRSKKYFKNK